MIGALVFSQGTSMSRASDVLGGRPDPRKRLMPPPLMNSFAVGDLSVVAQHQMGDHAVRDSDEVVLMTRVCQCDGCAICAELVGSSDVSHLTQVRTGRPGPVFLSSRGPVYGARRPKLPAGQATAGHRELLCCALTCEPSFMRQRSAMIFARSADNAMPDTPAACPSKANHPASASNPFPSGSRVRTRSDQFAGVVQRSAGHGQWG